MKKLHEEYFKDMFASYFIASEIPSIKYRVPDPVWHRRYVNQIKSALQNLEIEYSLSLRADARFYLLNNIMTMVVNPFLLDGRREGIMVDVEHDLRVLIDYISHSNPTNKNISGHEIIIASYKMWEKLKTMGNDSW